MSQEAVRVKEEPGAAATDHVTIKAEPELTEAERVDSEAEYVLPLCVLQEVGVQVEPACTKQEPCVPPDVVYTELETVCVKEEPISVPVCVKEEPPWQESVSSEPGQEYKYELTLESGLPPAGTPDVKRINWDCYVRLERCVVPRGAALRWERAVTRGAPPRPAAGRPGAPPLPAAGVPGAPPRPPRAAAGRAGARLAAPSPVISRAHERQIAIRQISGSLIKRIDTIANAYSCEICKKQYKNLACLTTHKVGHTKKRRAKIIRSERNTYFCEICKAVFHDLDSLKVHALVHAKVTIPLYFCSICHKEFATNHALRIHRRAHEIAHPFKCHICKERFSRPNALARHIATHNAKKHRGKLTTLCIGCETKQALKQLGGLMRSEHGQTSENTEYCELCNNYV